MILKQIIPFVTILVLLVSCNRLKGPKKPRNLLTKEQMVNVIIDAKLISSASAAKKKIMRDSGVVIESYIYKRHNIDSLQFEQSNSYYAFHINDYEDIYTRVTDSLEALKKALEEQKAEEWKIQTKREEDSLKAIKKDSAEVLKVIDSINVKNVKDSLAESLLQQKFEENKALIAPISDTL